MRGLRGVVFFLFAAVAVITWAQAPVGNISGVVMDPSGAFIPGATVRATSISSGGVRTANANEQGYFLISTLQPGEYKVVIEYPGFANYASEPIVVEVGQTARLRSEERRVGKECRL